MSSDSQPVVQSRSSHDSRRKVRILVVAVLLLLTAQGWTGDFVNLFAAVPTIHIVSIYSFFQALLDSGVLTLYHALEGLAILVLSVYILVYSFLKPNSKNLRICALLATASVISATVGGVLFVLSSFQNNANSAQMGGSFIGAYAFYFLVLYFTK